jgi:superfamily II DNA/RNA helicase
MPNHAPPSILPFQRLKQSFLFLSYTMSSSATITHEPTTPPYSPTPAPAAGAGGDGSESAVGSTGASALREYTSFDEMNIDDRILRGIYGYGFEKPSPIQQKGIVPMMDGRDLLAQAQSGTGKTGCFLIGGISKIDTSKNAVQMVVICPTRELADQTANVARNIGTYIDLRVHIATGGPRVDRDLEVVVQGKGKPDHVPHILVVTPGRFYDLLNRKAVSPATIRVLVLDEADQMLEARFREQIHCILSLGWSVSTQVALLSATMIPELVKVAESLLRDPVTILLNPDDVTLEGIKQWYVQVERDDQKLDTLCDIYDHLSIQQATIFVNTRARAEWLADQMRRRGFDLDCIHGDMDSEERKRRMEQFRIGKVRVLISTDLLARGIDVQQISIVINYELPVQRENYIHRIGRSGRFGRKGASINLVTDRELRNQAEIERFYETKVNTLPRDLNIY